MHISKTVLMWIKYRNNSSCCDRKFPGCHEKCVKLTPKTKKTTISDDKVKIYRAHLHHSSRTENIYIIQNACITHYTTATFTLANPLSTDLELSALDLQVIEAVNRALLFGQVLLECQQPLCHCFQVVIYLLAALQLFPQSYILLPGKRNYCLPPSVEG